MGENEDEKGTKRGPPELRGFPLPHAVRPLCRNTRKRRNRCVLPGHVWLRMPTKQKNRAVQAVPGFFGTLGPRWQSLGTDARYLWEF
jgi:hypothetical protein